MNTHYENMELAHSVSTATVSESTVQFSVADKEKTIALIGKTE
jgi:hypothetical protein